MSEKMTCPVCKSHTSAVLHAVLNDDPCPTCGAPADVIVRVNELQGVRADEALKSELVEVTIQLGRITAERDRLRLMVNEIRDVFMRDDREADRENYDEWRRS